MGLNSQNTPEEHHQNIFLYKVQFCPCETTENSPKLKLQKPTPTTKGLIFWCYRKMFMSRFSKIYVKINIKFSSSPISCKVNLYISPVFVCTSDYMYWVYILYFTSYEMTPSFHKNLFHLAMPSQVVYLNCFYVWPWMGLTNKFPTWIRLGY